MDNVHALVTGDLITGPIKIEHPSHPAGWVDVSPAVLYFDNPDHAVAVAQAIEDHHTLQGTHPAQVAAALAADSDPVAAPVDGGTL